MEKQAIALGQVRCAEASRLHADVESGGGRKLACIKAIGRPGADCQDAPTKLAAMRRDMAPSDRGPWQPRGFMTKTAMDLDRFLRRIRYDGPLRVDLDTLTSLQRAFLLTVPFENLDIHWGVPIVIDLDAQYAKIVDRHRGGFCYEVNHLFGWALRTIGFRVANLSAAVWADRDGRVGYGDPASHLLLRVDLDEPWIADVGFGESFRTPLPLVDGTCLVQAGRAYRLDRVTVDGESLWEMSTRDPQAVWAPGYRFVDVSREMDHFEAMCHFHQTSPRSPFPRRRLASLATPEGRLTLSGDEWIVADLYGHRTVTSVTDESEAATLLRIHLGIERRA